MADAAVHSPVEAGAFEPPFLGAYSKKVGMWLFLLSDSLTFGVLLFAYSYGRLSTPHWPTPFGARSIANASVMTACLLSSSLTMVMAVLAARRGDSKGQRNWILATMFFGAAFVMLHAKEWSGLIQEGLRLPIFPEPKGAADATGPLSQATQAVPQFPATFFGLTGMHMLHVTIGVIYLGVVALRKKFIPILLGLWLVGWLALPADSPFHYGIHFLLFAAVVAAIIVWLRPKVYDAHDVEVSGLYWHFVDLVWMFIFPLVYLMSTKVV